jgi:uroporphyrinogen-III synthase
MAARVIVTRPAREAVRWVEDLRAAGLDAVALPLIRIEPLDDAGALDSAWKQVREQDALMFVSAAAVEHFFRARPAVLPAWPRFWATGPGTTRALQDAGVPPAAIDAPAADAAQFDSEALWHIVRPQVRTGMRLLIVRGGDASASPSGRDWLAREAGAAGAVVDTVVAYRRLAPVFGEAERRIAAEGADGGAAWLFSSSEAIANLRLAMPGTGWQSARAIATHERIAAAAAGAGFGRVQVSQPSMAALVASIESLQ